MEIAIDQGTIFLVGGIVAVAVVIGVLYLVLSNMGSLLFWAIMGGPSFYRIGGQIVLAAVEGNNQDISNLVLKFLLFLKPYDEMMLETADAKLQIVIVIILVVWYFIILGFTNRAFDTPLISASVSWIVFYAISYTSEGLRTFLAAIQNPVIQHPWMQTILLDFYGVYFAAIGFVLLIAPVVIYTLISGDYKNFYKLPETLSRIAVPE